jgi:amino acid adenylation domain-containing protein
MFVHELIAMQAGAEPDAIAVEAGEHKLTYGKLNASADQLACFLRSFGVRAEVPVALFLERSTELAIAALAVLKAGGPYVPLDPSYPPARVSTLLEDSAARVVLTHSSVAKRLPPGPWRTILMDADDDEIARASVIAPEKPISPEDLAYIIFTSGSAGRPKGVQITHSNLLNLVHWHQRVFSITSSDRATLQASPGFDAAVWELWPYLTVGASVHVVDDFIRAVPEHLRNWILAESITVGFFPTAVAECMMNLSWPPQTALRFLLTGADTLRQYPPSGLPFAVVNNYGPTECTVVATSGEIASRGGESPISGVYPSIGRPVDNVEVHIVDEELNSVADGAPGELLIGGAGVGRGYLNLPELTAQKFIADPFNRTSGMRFYRSGDLARRLPDGQIEFIGRMDEQIKIRAYRIEPGEITSVLDRHPAVVSSCVAAYSNEAEEKHLVAYIVASTNILPNVAELQTFLGERLPGYMIPSTFVRLACMPMSAHGKVNRAELPKPTLENTLNDSSFGAPQSEIEQWLASLLASLLGVAHVGREDNFFNLGGHSLLGAQLIAKVHQRFAVVLSLRNLFDHPTIAGISSQVEGLIYSKLHALTDEEARRILKSSSELPA